MAKTVTEDFAPLGEAAVGGSDQCALFIAGVYEPEEEVSPAWGNGQVADFVDDQQRRAGVEADFSTRRPSRSALVSASINPASEQR